MKRTTRFIMAAGIAAGALLLDKIFKNKKEVKIPEEIEQEISEDLETIRSSSVQAENDAKKEDTEENTEPEKDYGEGEEDTEDCPTSQE